MYFREEKNGIILHTFLVLNLIFHAKHSATVSLIVFLVHI